MKRKLVSLVCILLVAFMTMGTIGGCGTKEVTDDSNTASNSAESNSTTGETPEADKQPIKMVYHFPGASDYQVDKNNVAYKKIMQTIKDNTGVDIQIEYYDWGDTYKQKMNMYAASKNLPSGVWKFPGLQDPFTLEILNKMGEAGMFADLATYIDDSANYPNLKGNAEDTFLKIFQDKKDGKQYIYPAERHRSFPHAPGGIAVRKDWLEESGLSYPTNQDELYNVIKTFKDKFKTVAGKASAPVSFNGMDNFTFWLNSWLGTSLWYEHDGRYDYGKYANIDQLKEALTFLNRLWRENLIDKESFTHKQEQFVQKGSNGTIGVTAYSYGGVYTVNDALNKAYPNSNKYFVSVPTFSASASVSVEQVNSCEIVSVPYNSIVVTKDISETNLKEYMKCIDYIGSYDASVMLLLGFEGTEWEKDKDGKILRSEAYNAEVAKKNSYQYNVGLCTYSALNPNPKALFDLLNCIATRPADVESVNNIKGHQVAIFDPMNIAQAGKIESTKWPLIEQAWLQMVLKAVSANSEAGCISAVDDWKINLDKLGYQDVVKERTQTASEMVK